MRLLKGEKVIACRAGDAVSRLACLICGSPAVRTIAIARPGLCIHDSEFQRSVSLCQDHFVEACILFPELQELERRSFTLACAGE
jgi:hypothetical protein